MSEASEQPPPPAQAQPYSTCTRYSRNCACRTFNSILGNDGNTRCPYVDREPFLQACEAVGKLLARRGFLTLYLLDAALLAAYARCTEGTEGGEAFERMWTTIASRAPKSRPAVGVKCLEELLADGQRSLKLLIPDPAILLLLDFSSLVDDEAWSAAIAPVRPCLALNRFEGYESFDVWLAGAARGIIEAYLECDLTYEADREDACLQVPRYIASTYERDLDADGMLATAWTAHVQHLRQRVNSGGEPLATRFSLCPNLLDGKRFVGFDSNLLAGTLIIGLEMDADRNAVGKYAGSDGSSHAAPVSYWLPKPATGARWVCGEGRDSLRDQEGFELKVYACAPPAAWGEDVFILLGVHGSKPHILVVGVATSPWGLPSCDATFA